MKLRILNALGKSFVVDVSNIKTLEELRRSVAAALALPLSGTELARLKLVKAGVVLSEDSDVEKLKDGDTLLAAVAPRPPPQKLRDMAHGKAEPEDEAETLLQVQLPANAPQWQRRSVLFLKDTMRIPEPILALVMRIGWKFWVGLFAWMALARVASFYDLGPPVVVGTCFALIALIGFTQRAEGSLSAYSLFNPNLERLPGQLTAEHMDGQMRRGQM